MTEIKIYRVSEVDWFAASSPKEALREAKEFYLSVGNEIDADDLYDPPKPLTEEEMDRFKFTEDCGSTFKKTFREKLREMVEAGEKFPTMFATSEF